LRWQRVYSGGFVLNPASILHQLPVVFNPCWSRLRQLGEPLVCLGCVWPISESSNSDQLHIRQCFSYGSKVHISFLCGSFYPGIQRHRKCRCVRRFAQFDLKLLSVSGDAIWMYDFACLESLSHRWETNVSKPCFSRISTLFHAG